MSKIVVNFTTWSGRDWAVPTMLKTFMQQTILPDKIVLWLSREEYNENEIPSHLLNCVNEYNILSIKFIDKNIFGHKRWEAFKYFNDDYNIMIDDDIYYPSTFVEELINAAKKYNTVISYFSRTVEYIGGKRIITSFEQSSIKNVMYSGLSCFPPHTFPLESYNYSELRDKFCKKCDDSWIGAWLLKHHVKIVGLHEWGNKKVFNEIEGTSDNSVWKTHNSIYKNGIMQKNINTANAIKIAGCENISSQIWPAYPVYEYADPDIDGVSICITAYHASDFIKECLDSIITQTWFKTHERWEILIGIDACNETLKYLKNIISNYKNVKVFMMSSNKGTYITTNTLMKLAKYKNLIRFDSDDLMCENMIETLMNAKKNNNILKFYLKNFGEEVDVKEAYGQILIDKETFDKFGGYQPWICSADAELLKRIKNFTKIKILNDVLMLRRRHKSSLTLDIKTSMDSDFRKPYIEYVKNLNVTNKNDAIIKCITNTYKQIPINSSNNIAEYIKNIIPIKSVKETSKNRFNSDGTPHLINNAKKNILLCAIVKNENYYIEEWVKHYESLGVSKIVIYDNDDNLDDTIENIPYIKNKIDKEYIECIHIPKMSQVQCVCYTDCYNRYKDSYDWLMFFDADEFLMIDSNSEKSLNNILSMSIYNDYDMIHVHWKIFDDNDILCVKDNNYSLVKRFTRELPQSKQYLNKEVKCIIRGGLNNIEFNKNPHSISKVIRCCNTSGDKCLSTEQSNKNITHKNMCLNHYICKTPEEFIKIKLKRLGGHTKHEIGLRYNLDYYFLYNHRTEEKYDYMLSLLNDLYNEEESNKMLYNKKINSRDQSVINDKLSYSKIYKTKNQVTAILPSYTKPKILPIPKMLNGPSENKTNRPKYKLEKISPTKIYQ